MTEQTIDELNRADPVSAFSELYVLPEHRDEPLKLLYCAGESFTLPESVCLIGTMNTAGRSLARVDAAIGPSKCVSSTPWPLS